MRKKLRVLPIDQACDCPFYMMDTAGQNKCLIKMGMTHMLVTAMMEEETGEDPSTWEEDCGGLWESCSILPHLYFMDESEGDAEEMVVGEEAIEAFDPFEDYDEDAEENPEGHDKEPQIATEIAENVPKNNDTIKGKKKGSPEKDIEGDILGVSVTVHKIANPYLVKGDIIVYPTNNMLDVDDDLLNQMSGGRIQKEAHAHRGSGIRMGDVYVTTNGGEGSHVKSKAVFHAVVAGSSRLVNEQDVSRAIGKALAMAAHGGAETVVLLPCDCGTLDIYATAMAQMSTVFRFIKANPGTTLKNVFVVMQDDESFAVFDEYHKRIFLKKSARKKQATPA